MNEFRKEDFRQVSVCPICKSGKQTIKYRKNCEQVKRKAAIVECGKCRFIYSKDYLTPEASNRFYGNKYKGSNYSNYHMFRCLKEVHFERCVNLVQEQCIKHGLRKPAKVLDLGCGEGVSTKVLEKKGLRPIGVEISSSAVDKAVNMNQLTVIQHDLTKLDLLNIGKFDQVYLFDVLDHVANVDDFVKQISNKLNENGLIFIDVCNIKSIYAHLMGKRYTHLIPWEHLSYFSKKSLSRLLRKHGIETLSVKNCPRLISYDFLQMTMMEFNPLIGQVMRLFGMILPSRFKSKLFPLPVGVISYIGIYSKA